MCLLVYLLASATVSGATQFGTGPDFFCTESFSPDFAVRRTAYLEYCASKPPAGVYIELARMQMGGKPNETGVLAELGKIKERRDCADFRVHSYIRLLYQFGNSPDWSPEVLDEIRETLLGFKYWPDEPGIDSMCYWSENHHILYASAGYLLGQLYPDEVFTNTGETGREKMKVHRPRVIRWLDLRFQAGFSEWLSNTYYVEDIAPLANLIDFCQDEEIVTKARMVLDVLLADIALNSHMGVFGSTHGRAYEDSKRWAAREGTTSVSRLMFGRGVFHAGNMAVTCLALSDRYRMPQVIYEMANDAQHEEWVNRQRMGIKVSDAKKWGLRFDNFEDGMVWLSMEAYTHPKVINLFARMLDEWNWWENSFYEPFKKQKKLINTARRFGLLPTVARWYEKDMTRNMRPEVNIYTYHTTDYMLSSAQDWRKGYGGDQQHLWQATLAPDVVCFTTHPAKLEGDTPRYWVGNGTNPRVAQHENVVIAIYDISKRSGLYLTNKLFFTHAWFPQKKFDEVVEADGWIFGRKDDAYIALRSQQPYHWTTEEGENQGNEVIADGLRNVWVCEMGRRAVDGEFEAFCTRIRESAIDFGRRSVVYDSPSQGRVKLGWHGAFRVDGKRVNLEDYPRYDNPYAQAAFPGNEVTFRCKGHYLELDYDRRIRKTDAFAE